MGDCVTKIKTSRCYRKLIINDYLTLLTILELLSNGSLRQGPKSPKQLNPESIHCIRGVQQIRSLDPLVPLSWNQANHRLNQHMWRSTTCDLLQNPTRAGWVSGVPSKTQFKSTRQTLYPKNLKKLIGVLHFYQIFDPKSNYHSRLSLDLEKI